MARLEDRRKVSAEGRSGREKVLVTFHVIKFGVLGTTSYEAGGRVKCLRLFWFASETQERETHPGNYFKSILIKMIEWNSSLIPNHILISLFVLQVFLAFVPPHPHHNRSI